jgi:hypothetical protein
MTPVAHVHDPAFDHEVLAAELGGAAPVGS